MSSTHKGGCFCGSVRYRVSGLPAIAQACHCKFCQRRTGSAFALLAAFKEDQMEITGLPMTQFEYRSDESDRWLRSHFCARCGTSVMITLEKNPGILVISGGTFDEPGWFKLTRHIWTRSAHDWIMFPPDTQVREKA
jgi:hypothetical protein